ncbi:hypothetical protein [Pseudonocardia sp.]|uniref:hypothetical protein n=1 Tax=Pseudonocardia sp. TaxID=60912 RepID=UPI003D0B2514
MADAQATALTTHELLLALAGRVDDDLLATCRELVAVGEDAPAFELLTAALVAGAAQLSSQVRETLVAAAARVRIDLDADRLLPPAAPESGTGHRFRADTDVPGLSARIAEALAAHRPGGGHSWLTWRTTPAGSAPGPLPHPVLLVEIPGTPGPEDHAADVLAYRLSATLQRVGLAVGVEVFVAGSALPAYHGEALSTARPVPSPAPAAPIDAPGPPATGLLAVVPAVSRLGHPLRQVRPGVDVGPELARRAAPSLPAPFDPSGLARADAPPTAPIDTNGVHRSAGPPSVPRRRRADERPDEAGGVNGPLDPGRSPVGDSGGHAAVPPPAPRPDSPRPDVDGPGTGGTPVNGVANGAPAWAAPTDEVTGGVAPAERRVAGPQPAGRPGDPGPADRRPADPGSVEPGSVEPRPADIRGDETPPADLRDDDRGKGDVLGDSRLGVPDRHRRPDPLPGPGPQPDDAPPTRDETPARDAAPARDETPASGAPPARDETTGAHDPQPPARDTTQPDEPVTAAFTAVSGLGAPATDPYPDAGRRRAPAGHRAPDSAAPPEGGAARRPGPPRPPAAGGPEPVASPGADAIPPAHRGFAPDAPPAGSRPVAPLSRSGPDGFAPPDDEPAPRSHRRAEEPDDPWAPDDRPVAHPAGHRAADGAPAVDRPEDGRVERVLRVVGSGDTDPGGSTPLSGVPAVDLSDDDPPLMAEMHDPLMGPLRTPLLDPLLEPTGSFRAVAADKAVADGPPARVEGTVGPPEDLPRRNGPDASLPRRSSHAARFLRPFGGDGDSAVSGADLFAESVPRRVTSVRERAGGSELHLDPNDPLGVGDVVVDEPSHAAADAAGPRPVGATGPVPVRPLPVPTTGGREDIDDAPTATSDAAAAADGPSAAADGTAANGTAANGTVANGTAAADADGHAHPAPRPAPRPTPRRVRAVPDVPPTDIPAPEADAVDTGTDAAPDDAAAETGAVNVEAANVEAANVEAANTGHHAGYDAAPRADQVRADHAREPGEVVDPMSTLTATERDLLRLLHAELAARERPHNSRDDGDGSPPDLAG